MHILIYKLYITIGHYKTYMKMNNAKDLIDISLRRTHNKHMKTCSTTLVIRETKVKATRYHSIPTRMTMIKKKKRKEIINNRAGKDGEKL